jgi:serine/threonine-protein kinase
MREVLHGEIPKPRDTNPAVPEELERIILKALSFNREDRYATAMELDADLELFLGKSAPVTNRDIARFVAHEFEDVRAETKRIIDKQLKRRASLARSSQESGVEAPPPLLARSLGHTGDTPTSPESMATPLQMSPTSPSPSPSPKGLRSLLVVGAILVVVCFVAWRVSIGFRASAQAGVGTAAPSAESLVQGPTPPASVSVPAPQQTAPSATAVSTEVVAAPSATPPTRPSGKPAAFGPRVAPPAPSGSASARPSKAKCESPYIIDADGIKRIKVECL